MLAALHSLKVEAVMAHRMPVWALWKPSHDIKLCASARRGDDWLSATLLWLSSLADCASCTPAHAAAHTQAVITAVATHLGWEGKLLLQPRHSPGGDPKACNQATCQHVPSSMPKPA